MAIKLIQTGGTIDKKYNWSDGSLYFTESSIASMLERGRCTVDINFETLSLLDSMDMDDDYRSHVVELCLTSKEQQIIVTHGTDTMVETAKVISEKISHKTVVLIGAMIPYSIENSDALFNLGSAVTAVQCMPAGVYVVMNGQVFEASNVIKNRSKGLFETLQ